MILSGILSLLFIHLTEIIFSYTLDLFLNVYFSFDVIFRFKIYMYPFYKMIKNNYLHFA